MRKLAYIVACFALIGIGCLAGYSLRHRLQATANQEALNFLGFGQTDQGAPPLEFWTYPGAKLESSGSGGGISMNGDVVMPQTHTVIWTTTDSFEEVIRFYAKRLEFDHPDNFATRTTIAGESSPKVSTATGPQNRFHIRDNGLPGGSYNALRPVRAECLISRSRDYFLTVFITQADSEDHTHIVVANDIWKKSQPEKDQH